MSLVNEVIDKPVSSTNPSISAADITTCINVLSQFNSKKSILSMESNEFDVIRPLIHNLFHLDKRQKTQKRKEAILTIKHIDRKAKDKCLLRSGRARKLQQLHLQNTLVPDGVVDIDLTTQPALEGKTLPLSSTAPERLLHPIICYICKLKYRTLHFFYDRLCLACAQFNFEKRLQTVDLSNRIALVTGGRIKIGYRIVLKLLRANCFVISTTRFPVDFLRRLHSERDFDAWKDRVHIYGVDFRYSQLVEEFAQMIVEKYDRLDFLINNACQTIQRPNEFYQHLIGNERIANYSLLPKDQKQIVHGNMLFYTRLSPVLKQLQSSSSLSSLSQTYDQDSIETSSSSSSSLSTINNISFDVNQQPIDRRSTNSWTAHLADLSAMEINEVLTINTLAPFILNSQLKILMANKHPEPESIKFIINVSAMEGSFSRRNKTDRHPHTNAAKAALNMMTRTSAADYKKSNIYMVSVDTGWINDEKPLEQAYRSMIRQDFQTPLDEEDAAARVLDPIISTYRQLADGKIAPNIPSGCFLKDYRICNW